MMTLVERALANAPRTPQASVEPKADAAADEHRARKRAERAVADRARGRRCSAMRPLRDIVDERGWDSVAERIGVPIDRAIQLSCGAEPREHERCAIARALDEFFGDDPAE